MLMLVLAMKIMMLVIILTIMMIMLVLMNDQYVASAGDVLLPKEFITPRDIQPTRISKINLEGSRFKSHIGILSAFPWSMLVGY